MAFWGAFHDEPPKAPPKPPYFGNAAAFPRPDGAWDDDRSGMTLRDWFAGQSLAGGTHPALVYEVADTALRHRRKP